MPDQPEGTAVEVKAASELASVTPYDVLVVDEAQDLMTLGILEDLERALAGGWAEGRWTHVPRPEQAGPPIWGLRSRGLEYVQSFGPVRPTLKFQLSQHPVRSFSKRGPTRGLTGSRPPAPGPRSSSCRR